MRLRAMPQSHAAELGRLAQQSQAPPGRDEGFLRQVFTLAEAAGGAVGERADEGLVTHDDLAEGVAVAAQAFRHQLRVVAGRRCHRFGCHHITAYVVRKQEKVTGNRMQLGT